MFAEEKPLQQMLPLETFRYYKYGKRTVQIDGSIRGPACCCANTWDRNAAATATAMKIVRGAHRSVHIACWPTLDKNMMLAAE